MPTVRVSLQEFIDADLGALAPPLATLIDGLRDYSMGYDGFFSFPFSIGSFLDLSETMMAAERQFNFYYEDIEQVVDRMWQLDPEYAALFQTQTDSYINQLRTASQAAADAMQTSFGDGFYIGWTILANFTTSVVNGFETYSASFRQSFAVIRLTIEAATFGAEILDVLTDDNLFTSGEAGLIGGLYSAIIEPMSTIDDAFDEAATNGFSAGSTSVLLASLALSATAIRDALVGVQGIAHTSDPWRDSFFVRLSQVVVSANEVYDAIQQVLAVSAAGDNTAFSQASSDFLDLAERTAYWRTVHTFTKLVTDLAQLVPLGATTATILGGFTDAANLFLDGWEDISLLPWRNQFQAYTAAEPNLVTYAGFQDLMASGLAHLDTLTGGSWGGDIASLASLDGIMSFGTSSDDTIVGTTGGDRVWAGAGADLVQGGNGNDRLWGEAGDDTVEGGAGNDTLIGSLGGRDTLFGGSGDDLANELGAKADSREDLGFLRRTASAGVG